MEIQDPHIIDFGTIGKPSEGYLSICEFNHVVSFDVKRCFWTYFTPQAITRGRHAHFMTEMVLIAVAGVIDVELEDRNAQKWNFKLSEPHKGLYIPPMTWHVMTYSHNAIQMVLTSTHYDEADYIRDYSAFEALTNKSL